MGLRNFLQRGISQSNKLSVESLIFLSLLAIQFALQPSLNRQFIPREFPKPVIVLLTEFTKTVICFLILKSSKLDLSTKWTVYSWSVRKLVKYSAFPAMLYAFQNILVNIATQRVDPIIFNVVNQSKTLFAAIFVYFLMGKGQTAQQTFSLTILFLCSIAISLPVSSIFDSSLQFSSIHSDHWVGLTCVALASVLSGLSAAVSQYVCQTGNHNNYLFTMEMGLISIIFLLPAISVEVITTMPNVIFIPILSNALGGILVGKITKEIGAVGKSYSIAVGMMLTCFLSGTAGAWEWSIISVACASIVLHVFEFK